MTGASNSLAGGFAAFLFRGLLTVVGCGPGIFDSSPSSSALTIALLLRFAGAFFSDITRLVWPGRFRKFMVETWTYEAERI